MDVTKTVIDILTPFYANIGFKKSGKSWYKKTEHAYIVCQYQKSSFSDDFYLNFGIAFIGLLNTTKKPLTSNDWHFDGRYEQILGDPGFRIQIEQSNDEDYFKNLLSNITKNIEKFILPYLYQWSDIEYLKTNFKEKFDHNKLWIQKITDEELEAFLNSL